MNSICESKITNISQALTFFPVLPLTEEEKKTFPTLFSLLGVCSLVLNIYLLQSLISSKLEERNKTKRQPKTDNFIISLCVSDLLITLLVIPGTVYRLYNDYEWQLSSNHSTNLWTCKLSAYFQSVASYSSIFTLTALSIERSV